MSRKWPKKRLFFPIRFKILISLLVVLTVMLGIITFTMTQFFYKDKMVYVQGKTSATAISISEQILSLLNGYQEKLQVFARLVYDDYLTRNQKKLLLSNIFQDFGDFVAIRVYENGDEMTTVYDKKRFDSANLDRKDFIQFWKENPLPFDKIQSGQVIVRNSTLRKEMPTLTMAVPFMSPSEKRQIIIAAEISLDSLLRLSLMSREYEVFLVDDQGIFLAYSDPDLVVNRTRVPASWLRQFEDNEWQPLEIRVREYAIDGQNMMLGGLTRIDLGNLRLGVQMPKKSAYAPVTNLFQNLIWLSLVIIIIAAILSLIWAHKMTRPIEQLSNAAKIVGEGKFDIQIDIKFNDEIGVLADSFNKMAIELNAREVALQQAQAQLIHSEKMAAFGQLGAGIAHEVKNPLAGILGFAQLSLRKIDKKHPLYNNLTIIEKETKRCKGIIENLMKFARQEEVSFEPIEINRVVEETLAIVDHQLGIHQIMVEKELASDLPEINGNANQIQQVIMNIMINAQQAMDGRPGLVKITTGLTDEERITIKISDDGPGIPEEALVKLFEPFFTTKPAGKGTGLGLSVSYGIIKDHGGEIFVKSEPGKGATFVINFPSKTSRVTISAC